VSPATVVLVHGAGAGGWTWHLVVDRLAQRGIESRAPDLPSADASDNSVGLADDVACVRGVIHEIDGPVVLVGNSYGGFVISGAAVGERCVRRLVYVAALMPNPGEALLEVAMPATVPSDEMGLSFLDDGRIVFDPEADLASSFQLAPPDEVEWIRPRLGRPMSIGSDANPVLEAVAWNDVPSTYVVCAQDKALRPDAQRTWAKERATEFVELDSDHCPQHSQPDALTDLLEKIARA
jgi:pimeloyl-ACP methyl ester carboxylesterase